MATLAKFVRMYMPVIEKSPVQKNNYANLYIYIKDFLKKHFVKN
jgi:hypothetical protein